MNSSLQNQGRILVTGAAGFIGSNLVDLLLAHNYQVIGFDNLSTGHVEFLSDALRNPLFTLIEGDVLDTKALKQCMHKVDFVFHLSANADIRFGLNHPEKDLQQNTVATFNVLEAMRLQGVRRIAFSSTGSVYGEATVIPTPENAPFPIQTSLYGASKVAGEALIQAYCEGFEFEGYIFRFVSILGERYTHGHVFDFCKQLLKDPNTLKVLGNGRQRKSYLYVKDCVEGMLQTVESRVAQKSPHKVYICNLGTKEYCEVLDSIRWICEELGATPQLELSGGDRGWVGDNPFIFLDTSKVLDLDWAPKSSIRDGIKATTRWLLNNSWVFEKVK